MRLERIDVAPGLRWLTDVVLALLIFLGLFGFQALGLPQPITGPMVNAALLATALIVGPWHAVGIGALTPVVAFARGILAAPLAPMIPFIAISNAVMVGLFYFLCSRKHHTCAVLASAAVKFVLLAVTVQFLVSVPAGVATMMQWPQLLTALAGGFLVLAGMRTVRKRR